MKLYSNSFFKRIVAFLLVISLLTPCVASASETETIQPYASNYLTSYNTYMYAAGSGQVRVYFHAMGTGDMDEIGVLSIKLYESTDNATWTRVKTYSHENYSSMLAYDDYYHSSYVSYQGVAGRYYKAYVCIWAGKNGSGDTRYMWATSVKAT